MICLTIPMFFAGCSNGRLDEDGWYDEASFNYVIDYDYGYYGEKSTVTVYLDMGNDGNFKMTNIEIEVAFYNGNIYLSQGIQYLYPDIYMGERRTSDTTFYLIYGHVTRCEMIGVYCDYLDDSGSPFYFEYFGYILIALVAAGILALPIAAAVRVSKNGGSGAGFFFFGWLYIACSAKANEWKSFSKTVAIILGLLFNGIVLSGYVIATLKNKKRSDQNEEVEYHRGPDLG